MDFSKLSEETMAFSQKIGDKQRQLLFDQNFFSEDCSIESVINEESVQAGIFFGLDTSLGSFCLRGIPVENFYEANSNKSELISNNSQLKKVKDEKIEFFPCSSFEIAQVICDQMMNRRFPYEEDSLCNISDPGPSWWVERGDGHLRIYFKSMGRAQDSREKIGPIGDPEVTKVRWEQASEILNIIHPDIKCEISENGIFIASPETDTKANLLMDELSEFLVEGEINRSFLSSLPRTYYSNIFKLYLKELAACRKFWMEVETLITQKA